MSKTQQIKFSNRDGHLLSARMDLPLDQKPIAYVLFAHCFTCNKNFKAVRQISRSLTKNGLGVMSLDFTGLGLSEGNFTDTTFSDNVRDLVDGMDYLGRNYRAPALLIGHSLGGAAVIFASKEKPSVKAVVTIGTPATTDHVLKLFAAEMHRLQEEGFADVTIGGRKFRIRDQFVQDVQDSELNIIIKDLQKALLILHAPQDRVVGVENAAKIYKWARHPKSFISLDGADHILSSKDDGLYAGEVIAAWVMRYLEVSLIKDKSIQTMHQVAVRLHNEDGYTTDIKTAGHSLLADEPESVGGQFLGPGPYELLMASLGSCTVMTVHMYARRKKWPLEEVTTHLNFSREHAEDSEHCGNKDNYLNQFELILEIKGDLTQSQVQRLFEIAGKCPVHKTLKGRIHIELKLADAT